MAPKGNRHASLQVAEAPAAHLAGAAELNPARTQTQQAIAQLLQPESADPASAMAALMQLDSQALPSPITNDMLDPRRNPGFYCYDMTSEPKSWTAHKVCRRCAVLLQLCSVTASSTSSAAAHIAGSAHLATRCASDAPREQHNTPLLPLELLEMIIEFAIADMRVTKDGSAVCRLMHTSSWVRYHAVKAFPLPSFQEADSLASLVAGEEVLSICRHLSVHIWDALELYATDFSVKRHANKTHALPHCTHEISGRKQFRVAAITCTAIIGSAAFRSYRFPENMAAEKAERKHEWKAKDPAHAATATVADICATVDAALQGISHCARWASPYARALLGELDITYSGAAVGIILGVSRIGPEPSLFVRRWQFEHIRRS